MQGTVVMDATSFHVVSSYFYIAKFKVLNLLQHIYGYRHNCT